MLHTWARKSLLYVLYSWPTQPIKCFIPENKPTYQTFEAGAERGSDSDTRNNSAFVSEKISYKVAYISSVEVPPPRTNNGATRRTRTGIGLLQSSNKRNRFGYAVQLAPPRQPTSAGLWAHPYDQMIYQHSTLTPTYPPLVWNHSKGRRGIKIKWIEYRDKKL